MVSLPAECDFNGFPKSGMAHTVMLDHSCLIPDPFTIS
jgi:hypothetical protein